MQGSCLAAPYHRYISRSLVHQPDLRLRLAYSRSSSAPRSQQRGMAAEKTAHGPEPASKADKPSKLQTTPDGMDEEAAALADFLSVPSASRAWLSAGGTQLTVCLCACDMGFHPLLPRMTAASAYRLHMGSATCQKTRQRSSHVPCTCQPTTRAKSCSPQHLQSWQTAACAHGRHQARLPSTGGRLLIRCMWGLE